jgi:hypothetical protein
MMQNETTVDPRGGRWFWPAWGAAFLGFPIGGAAATALVGPIETVGAAAVAGAVAGGVIGAAQWVVLRRRLPLSPLWAPATAGAMAIGMALGHALLGDDTSPLPLLLRGLVTGAAIGAAQALLLRGVLRAPTIWGAVVTLGWPLGWAVSVATGLDLAPKWSVFGATGALAFQLATGLTLAYLLRRPARALAPAPEGARWRPAVDRGLSG